jgi:hypothetical protein
MLVVVAALAATPIDASIAQSVDQPFPFDELPTHVVGIAPPEGWRTAYFSVQGVVAELGELTPDADVHAWRDLMAYMTIATLTNQRVDDMNANLAEVATHCSAHAMFSVRPALAQNSDAWAAIVCFDRPGQANSLAEAPLQIYLFRSLSRNDATFRFWRAWRGAPGDVVPMLARIGVNGIARVPANPTSEQLRVAFEPAMQALAEVWGADLVSALEVCDLAGEPCASLNRSVADVSAYEVLSRLEPVSQMAGVMFLEGDRSDLAAAAQFYRDVFGRDPPITDSISFVIPLKPSSFAFNRAQSMVNFALMLHRTSKGTGGLFSVSADAPPPAPAEQARMRAYLVKIARLVASAPDGPAYDRFRFDLWPNQ